MTNWYAPSFSVSSGRRVFWYLSNAHPSAFRCLSYSVANEFFDQSLYTTAARSATAPDVKPATSAKRAILFLMRFLRFFPMPKIIPNFPPLEAEKNCDIMRRSTTRKTK